MKRPSRNHPESKFQAMYWVAEKHQRRWSDITFDLGLLQRLLNMYGPRKTIAGIRALEDADSSVCLFHPSHWDRLAVWFDESETLGVILENVEARMHRVYEARLFQEAVK